MSVDVVDEGSEEPEEPKAPSSTCCTLPLIGHGPIDARDPVRDQGPKVGNRQGWGRGQNPTGLPTPLPLVAERAFTKVMDQPDLHQAVDEVLEAAWATTRHRRWSTWLHLPSAGSRPSCWHSWLWCRKWESGRRHRAATLLRPRLFGVLFRTGQGLSMTT